MSEARRLDWDAARKRLQAAQTALESESAPPAEEIARVYRERAQFYAQEVAEQEHEKTVPVLVFEVAAMRYGVPASDVVEVILKPKITPVPGAPPMVSGLIQARGEIRPVLNLPMVLGLPEGRQEMRKIILLRHGSRMLGIGADHVEQVEHLNPEKKQPASSVTLAGSWLTPDYITVLEVQSLFQKLQTPSPL